MKKVILVLVLVLVSISTFAQWEKKFYVDDFGDKTTESYMSLLAIGTFSNSAGSGLDCSFKFIDGGDSVILKVYEYDKYKMNIYKSRYVTVKIKTPSGAVEVIKNAMASKTGVIYFAKESYSDLKSALSENGTYTLVFSTGDSKSYKAKFKI